MAENVIDFTMTNWITVFIMVILGLIIIAISIGVYTKIKGAGGSSGA